MNNQFEKRLNTFVILLYDKLSNNNNRITICAVGTAQYINFLIEKGFIFSSEKVDYSKKALEIIEQKYGIEIFDFIKSGLIELMQEMKTYDYETISPIVKKVNETFN